MGRRAKLHSMDEFFKKNPDVTVRALAKALGVSEPFMSDVLNRKRRISFVMACRIEGLMGITSGALMDKLLIQNVNDPEARHG